MTTNNKSPMVLTYGVVGSGKSVDCGYSCPNALFLAVPNSLRSIETVCGYTPAAMDIKTIQEATKIITQAKDQGFDAIVVDDFSFLAEQTFASLDRIKNTQHRWGALRETTLEFRNAARYAGITVVMNCWEKAPSTKGDGSFVRGGPMLSGKLPEQLPAMCDLVLRCGRNPQRKPWGGVYICEHSSQYVMKDRYNVAYHINPLPMNIAEILRAADVPVSRMKGMEWQEEVVETFTQELQQSNPNDYTNIVETLYSRLLSEGIDHKQARWTIRDVLDRTVIRNAITQRSQKFFA